MLKRFFLLLALVSVTLSSGLRAATITKVKYRLNGSSVARVIYTGGDGWKAAKYWQLLAGEPEIVSEMKIQPDKPGGKVATLKGTIVVSITIRNSKMIGVATTDTLTLIRKDGASERWHLSKEETKRLAGLAKEPK